MFDFVASHNSPRAVSDQASMKARHRTDMLATEIAFNLADVVIVVLSDVTLQVF